MWYNVNEEIQTWDYLKLGDTYAYHWINEGIGNKTTRTLSHSSGFDAEIIDGLGVNIEKSGNVVMKSRDENESLGNAKVEFGDESANGYIYNREMLLNL